MLCREHVGFDVPVEDPVDPEDPGDRPDHDPATCSCSAVKPCPACRLAVERDAVVAKLAVLSRAVAALIARNGFCVVCERYAPFHLVGCAMGHVNS